MFKPRASALGRIMTDGRGSGLSVGAKTYLYDKAKEIVYGYSEDFTSKYTEKGTEVEQLSIDLYNSVFFTSYRKNTERRENEWVTGECDIYTGNKIVDIKSPWSLKTFPAVSERGINKDYEWQLRAYMWLWDVEEAELAYCMVSTPDYLVGYEEPEIHYVDHIDPELRITRVLYQRDRDLEEKIKEKSEAAQQYVQQAIEEITEQHEF